MPDLPVILKVSGRRCVVVGGGPVALRRTLALLEAGAQVTVVAPIIEPGFRDLAVTLHERPYESGDLRDALLVVIATDDATVNQRIADEARREGVLMNRTDDPQAGDLSVPAHAHHGPVTIAVHTGGVSASAAATIRRQLSAALDPDWPRLLELVAPFRARIQAMDDLDTAQRQRLLTRLTDEHAMTTFKDQGPDALLNHCRGLLVAPAAG